MALVTSEISALKKKLALAIENRKAVESAMKVQQSTLVQLIARLSLSCKGLDKELDNRLAKFRQQMQKGTDFEVLAPLIDDIMQLLKQQEQQQNANLTKLHQSVQQAGTRLQKTKGLPDELRRSLRHLLSQELEDVQATHDFVPLLSKLIDIYHKVLQKKNSQGGDATRTEFAPELAIELVNLSEQLVLSGELGDEFTQIKTQITAKSSINDLLDSSLTIIRLVTTHLINERQSAQQFLVTLNDTLSVLHKSLLESLEKNTQFDVEIDALNKTITGKIDQLGEETQAATSIDALKSLISQKLTSLTQDISKKEKIELAQREYLSAQYQTMQSRVDKLEGEVTHYREQLAEQSFKSMQDSLTKLPNRTAFDERFNLEFNNFKRNQNPICLVVLDVDHFKRINDTYGHSAGDKTLQVLASALKKHIRVTDFIARFGGEEFILLMPNADISQVAAPLEKIRRAIKAIPFMFKNTKVQITISMGVAQFKQDDDKQALFDRADEALYKAKREGRDRIEYT